MKTIWKFKIPIIYPGPISMPADSVVLDVRDQGGDPCLWALVDPDAQRVERLFLAYGTGHELPDMPGMYYGTIHYDSTPPLVLHIFEEDVVNGMRRLYPDENRAKSSLDESCSAVGPGEEE